MLTLLATLWQSDSAFPNGAFAFSNGIEGLAELGERLDRDRLAAVLATTLTHRWARMDAIAVLLAFAAVDDLAGLVGIDSRLEAATLPAPQRSGSRRNGLAFLTSHARIGTTGASALKVEVDARRLHGHLPVMQGALWHRCGLDETSALAASAYGAASTMVSAAVRLGLVGAVDAQRALAATLPVIAGLIEEIGARSPVSADDFASMSPLLDIATMRHATSEVRLFSN
ncbi:urease accessory protein UreF [Xanthobacter aminoxidans]|uniref:urease accessory protein UreF n=1 Tax=Xanthobacter aminoxidans TaxID=186280 RepID=UPI002022B879|nr:urease accessory UreF family protein [Xanthobacter aminoxidans]MCL8385589.1 urease accessory protein UreF [Xanthobacter aminoxidans]